MKIRDVRLHVLEAELSEPFHWSLFWTCTRGALIVEIVTEDGLTGFGECYGPARLNAAVVEAYKPLLVGEDALARERIWQNCYNLLRDHGQRGVAVQALSGVDIALWDLAGKHHGVPVHRLLGGPIREDVQAYATGLYRRDAGDPVDYLVEEARGYVEAGMRAMKLKVGLGVAEDEKIARALRAAIGPEIALMIDANHAYDTVSAIALGRRLADLDIGWFEEPVPPEDLDGYRELRAKQPIPVAGGECAFTRFGMRDLLAGRCVDVLQPDTCAAGGISECVKIAAMANAHGIRYVPHVWGTGIAVATALHVLAVLPHNPPCLSPIEPLLEFDRTEHPIRDAIVTEPFRAVNGRVAVPTGPGLGIEIDREALERFRVA